MKRILLLLLILTCSCTHKELCTHHPHDVKVRVDFDWMGAPEANPEGMCVFFYPIEGGQPRRYDFKGTKGGEINITVGQYMVMCYNNDTEGVLFRNKNDFCCHEAYTRDGNIFESIYGNGYAPPQKRGTEPERVVICPDMMWGSIATEVDITESGISYTCTTTKGADQRMVIKEHVITLYPVELTCIYTYEIRNVKNLKHATQMCATISGMAGGINLSTQDLHLENITLPLESTFDKASTITGRFITFGHHEDNDAPHRMELYVWMDDGQKVVYGTEGERFDVTDQVHNAPDKRRVHIVIDGLDLPQPIENGHGFKPSVDDWEIVEGDIMM
jgi:hypothetical protein